VSALDRVIVYIQKACSLIVNDDLNAIIRARENYDLDFYLRALARPNTDWIKCAPQAIKLKTNTGS
jgi:hypothetical protein